MKYLIVLATLFIGTSSYAQEWIASQPYPQPIVPPSIVYPIVPVHQPVVIYQWVPYATQQNIVVEQYCLFRRTQTVISRPTVQWVYQPVIVYR